MFGFRSARGRAIVVGLVLALFLVGVTALTIWRNEDYNRQLDKLERASDAATSLEHARAQLYLQTSLLSGLAFSQDAALVDEYRQAQAVLEQNLIQARAEATARGDADQLAVLDDLTARMAEFQTTANLAIPLLLGMDPPAARALTASYLPSVRDEVGAMFADLDQLAETGRTELASERAAMDHEAGITFWLIVARSAVALVLTGGIATVVLLSVLRPLASLRLSARAIASGNLQARAKVYGPEEVASLARDFNRMTDALGAKTEEYITTTNLTGDVIGKVDAQGRWTFLNDAAWQFLGKPRERLLGTDAAAVVHPEDLESTVQALQQARAKKEPIKGLVNRLVTPMGTRVVEWNAYPLFDKDGRDVGLQITGRDITERKRVEEALRQSEQRYRELFEQAPAMYVICRDQGGAPNVADCNGLFLSALGYVRDEVVGRPVADFYTPESAAQLVEGGGFQRALTGHFVEEERQLVTKDGRIVETVLRAVPEIGPGGRVLGTRAMYVDITERKQVEEALRQSEQRYRLLTENTSDLIWTMDLSLRYTYMSPAITRMRGYTVEEIMGTTVQETMTPGSLEAARKTLAEQLAMEREGNADPNRSTKLELEMYCKDGSTIWTEMNMTFLRDGGGRPTGILGVTRDITVRKRTEEALADSERRYRLIAENATDLIWTTDMNLRYTYISPSVARLRGYSVEEAMVHRVDQDLCPSSLDVAMKALAEELPKEGLEGKDLSRSRTLELEHFCKDGSTVWLEVTTTFLRDEDGRPVGLLGVSRDITERKQGKRALEQSEKRYRLLAENVSDVIFTTDMAMRYTYVSPSVTRMRGYSVEEVMGGTLAESLAPGSLEVARRIVAEALALEKAGDPDRPLSRMVEVELNHKDGSTIWAEVTATFLRDADGQPVGLLGVSRDITERKRAEAALRTKDSAIASSINAIALANLEGTLTYVNPSLLKMWGFDDEEEILGRNVSEFWQTKKKALEVGKALRDEGSWAGELVAIRRDGSPFHVDMLASTVTDEADNPICMMGSFLDVTERKQTAEALEESEKRYRLLAENATDIIWTMDMNLRFTYESPSVTRIRGYSPAEAMAQTIEETLTPASVEVARKALAEELVPEKMDIKDLSRSRTLELEHTCKDGSTVWLEVTTTFLRGEDGRPVGLLGASRDITERKRAEEESESLHAELETRAITDSLTGLYNHAYFYQRLAHEIERSGRYGHRFALVMMDVDAFKHYNDSRGHQAGDQALRLVGECIRSAMRRSDLAFRYGGDEFVAILLNADVPRAQAVVRRVNRRIAARLKELGDSAGAWLGLSAGVACFPEDATTVDELVGMADAAMYDAKRLAWARGVMGRRQAVESVACPVEVLHETQARMLSGAASSLAAALEDLTAPQGLAQTDLRTLAALGAAAEIKDPYILGHQERTSRLAATVAKELGLPPDRVRNITTAGLLHDLGKVSVGEGILNKPGKLSESEFTKMKEHPALGATMIVSGGEALQPLAPIVRHHHERFDGSGYPDGLARENIPLEARILSVADAFDAMTHERAYRKALSTEEALGEIERGVGTRFDREVVDAFLGVVRRRAGEPG